MHEAVLHIASLTVAALVTWGASAFFVRRGLLPTFTFVTAVMNNDNLLVCLGTCLLALVTRPDRVLRTWIVVGVLLGLCFWTKLTASLYCALLLCIAGAAVLERPVRWGAVAGPIRAVGIGLFFWSPLAWRNVTLYGSPTAEHVANVREHWPSLAVGVVKTLTYMQSSFWATAGIRNNVKGIYPILGSLVSYVPVIGLLVALRRRRADVLGWSTADTTTWIVLLVALAVNWLLVFRFGILYAQGQGRFFFPMLVPLAIFFAAGFRSLPGFDAEHWESRAASVWMAFALSFGTYALGKFWT